MLPFLYGAKEHTVVHLYSNKIISVLIPAVMQHNMALRLALILQKNFVIKMIFSYQLMVKLAIKSE